ncbi:MAG: caspase family protein, partial [Cephaloticoccus sp.]|nr:caspase family protein [Cephaloticoccus sp.]
MLRFASFLALLTAFAPLKLSAAGLAYGHWVDNGFKPAGGPAAELVEISTSNSFTLHDRATLAPRFIVRDGHTPFMYLADGRSLLIHRGTYQLLDLTTGETRPFPAPGKLAALFQQPDTGAFLGLIGEPDTWQINRLVVTRLDPTGRGPAQALGTITPLAMARCELRRVLPSRVADHALLVLRDVEDTGDLHDPHRWGDYQFIHLDLNTGKFSRLATLAAAEGLDLTEDLQWAGPDRNQLHTANYPDYAYILLDPYAGKVLRVLKVPGVQFHTDEPGVVTAIRRVQENGAETLYRDYLEPGTLKTIRNVPLADEYDRPERPRLDVPERSEWLTPDDAPVALIKIQPEWDGPYSLRRIDAATGKTLATYDGAGGNLYNYSGFAFHPHQPEFFASTGDGDVHFFRFTGSGLKRQVRGASGTSLHYTPDGESVLSTEFYEGPVSVTPAATLPFKPTFTYEYPPLRNTLPEYDQGLTLSPAHQWLILQSSTLSTLYRFGEPALVAQLPASTRDLPDAYAFSPDENRLARLALFPADEEDVAPPAELSVLNVAVLAAEGYDENAWSLELPSGSFRLAGWTPAGQLALIDTAAAELVYVTPGQDELRRVALPGLDDLKPGPPWFDPATQRLVLHVDDGLAFLTLGPGTPTITRVPLEAVARVFYRVGDGRHLAVKLANGALAFIDLAAPAPTLAATLEFYNEGRDYLLRTPGGQFDATRAIQVGGVMLRGYQPLRLAQVINQGYAPDLFSRLFAGLPLDATLPDVVVAPTVALTARATAASALRATLNLRAESKVQDLAELRVYQNDKLVATVPPSYERGANKDIELDLLLVPENTFRLVAVTTGGLESLPAEATLSPPEAELRRAVAAERPAELHLLVVGVNEYRNPEYNLNYAEADADGVLEKLTAVNRPLFGKINPIHLASAEATHDGILAAFERVRAAARPQDAFIFYFAGHGVMAKAENTFYLVPHDVTRIYGESQSLSANGISADALRGLSARIAAQKQLFILDACNSGGALQAFAQRGASQEQAIAQLARATGTHWITAASADQLATEFADLGHGAFTYTLLEALNGQADTGDQRVTVNELKAFLETELPAVSKRYKGSPQYP